jgi:hypothetical protein
VHFASPLCFGSHLWQHDAFLQDGKGCPMGKLTTAAFNQLQKNADQGNAEAQFALAGAYYNGNGVARNPVEGARWLLRAAEQGYVPAQCDLGVMYVKGIGVQQSYQDALKWLHNAAEQGDGLAQHSLGSVYAKGFRDKNLGFFDRVAFAKATHDYVEAYKWFTLAAKSGVAQSLKDRAIITKLWMKDYQIARAEQFVHAFEQARSAPIEETYYLTLKNGMHMRVWISSADDIPAYVEMPNRRWVRWERCCPVATRKLSTPTSRADTTTIISPRNILFGLSLLLSSDKDLLPDEMEPFGQPQRRSTCIVTMGRSQLLTSERMK